MPNIEYAQQRPKVTPPHISLVALRNAVGLKQVDVCREVANLLGKSFTPGALSAIENGHRGASAETLAALEVALGLRDGDLVVDYQPGHTRAKREPAA